MKVLECLIADYVLLHRQFKTCSGKYGCSVSVCGHPLKQMTACVRHRGCASSLMSNQNPITAPIGAN